MSTTPIDPTSKTSSSYNVVFENEGANAELESMDFMNLLILQMQNQDFMDPMDNSQMMEQMATMSNMQMMEQMAAYSKSSYALSLVGKEVTATRFTVGGELDTTSGIVEKVSLIDSEYIVYVGGKTYTLEQIMSLGTSNTVVDASVYSATTTDLTSDSVILNWQVPTEDELVASELTYSAYYSTSEEFDTVEAVEAGTLVGLANQKNYTSEVVKGLEGGTTYYLNVVVTDANGNKSVYKPAKIKTLSIGDEAGG